MEEASLEIEEVVVTYREDPFLVGAPNQPEASAFAGAFFFEGHIWVKNVQYCADEPMTSTPSS